MDFDITLEKVQAEVSYCVYCQPYDGGECVWIFGTQTCLDELFDELDVPEDWRDDMAAKLVCPFCGSDVFTRYADYGAKTSVEREADKRWDKWHSEFSPDVDDFAQYLEAYPYLGLGHPVGAKIHKAIKTFPTTHIENQTWCRARKPDGSKLLTRKDLLPPDPKVAKAEGRFSHYGQSVFYLASNKQAALSEILDRKSGEGIAWVQEFKIHDSGVVLDFRSESSHSENPAVPVLALGLIHDRLPRAKPDPDSAWKPEYFVPRFIADCAKNAGFKGIVFQSDKHYYANLVLFHWDDSNVEPLGEPKLVQLNPRSSPKSLERT